MLRYVTGRLAQAAGVLWAAYTVSFLVLYHLPGDPVAAMAAQGFDQATVDPARLDRLRAEYGFDKPVLVQYAEQLGRVVRGDLGDSVATGRSVTVTLAIPSGDRTDRAARHVGGEGAGHKVGGFLDGGASTLAKSPSPERTTEDSPPCPASHDCSSCGQPG